MYTADPGGSITFIVPALHHLPVLEHADGGGGSQELQSVSDQHHTLTPGLQRAHHVLEEMLTHMSVHGRKRVV